MGNTCSNCSQCKGDGPENSEVLTVDNKVSISYLNKNKFLELNKIRQLNYGK